MALKSNPKNWPCHRMQAALVIVVALFIGLSLPINSVMAQSGPPPFVTYGTIAAGNQRLCAPVNGAPIGFNELPSGTSAFTYQWFFRFGVVAAPVGNSTAGWNLETAGGNTNQTFDPPAGRTSTRTYACFVTPTMGTPSWAQGTRIVEVIGAFNIGTVNNNGTTLLPPADPALIEFSSLPTGAASFSYQWYSINGFFFSNGNSTLGWDIIAGAISSSYDPPAGLTRTRSYRCFVTPIGACNTANTAGWANGGVTININPVNEGPVYYGVVFNGDESLCSPADGSLCYFSSQPQGGGIALFNYQWYARFGSQPAPIGTSTIGWTSEGSNNGAQTSTFNPPAGRTSSRTYACFVTPMGLPGRWAEGRKQVLITGACRNGFDDQSMQLATLGQNIPNPASGATSISLYIPEGSKAASLTIVRLDGRLVESVTIKSTGAYTHMVLTKSLAAGVYVYSLVVDGALVAPKRMIVL